MKKLLLTSTALAVLSAMPASADGGLSPGSAGWYVGASVGANWVQDTGFDTFFNGALEPELDTGWALFGNIGYKWGNLRTELELGYRSNDVDAVSQDPSGAPPPFAHSDVGGELTQFSIMANALYDIALTPTLDLTLGGGIGVADAELDASGSGDQLIVTDGDNWAFAYQLIAGLAYEVSPSSEVFVEYRYFANNGHDVITYPPPNVPRGDEADFDNHTISIGFRHALYD